MEDKKPIHPIGSVLLYNGKRWQVTGEYWNGKVDAQDIGGNEVVLNLSQQGRAVRIDVNAVPLPPATNRLTIVEDIIL